LRRGPRPHGDQRIEQAAQEEGSEKGQGKGCKTKEEDAKKQVKGIQFMQILFKFKE
jgi:hypothetical protein